MTQNYRTEIGPVTEDQVSLIVSDLNTTQVVYRANFHGGRAYISFWAEGKPEAMQAMTRATRNISADFRIRA